MNGKLIILFLVVSVFAATVMSNPPPKDDKKDCKPVPRPRPRPKCDKNEVFSKCKSACEPSCKNPKPKVCTQQCLIGCTCKKGLLRNKRGKCVKPCDC